MSELSLNLKDLNPYKAQVSWIQKTIHQLNKDLTPFVDPIDVDLKSNTPFDDLVDELKPYIAYLINNQFEQLCTILYRIDLGEDIVRQQLLSPQEDADLVITRLIVERELKKVVIREYFQSH